MTDRTFIEDAEIDRSLPNKPAKPRPPRPSYQQKQIERQETWGHLLPYGTTVSTDWSDSWILNVSEVERTHGRAICGAKRNRVQMETLVRANKITEEDAYDNPLAMVCTFDAGLQTVHPGEGRCYQHGGNNSPNAKFSLLRHSGISGQVREYFENEELLDLRGAISMLWVSANAIIGDERDDLSIEQAKEVGALMTRVGNLTKQYNEMVEKRKLSIGIPEFISWSEYLYELAVKYILDGEKNVNGFLQEAEGYYSATVTVHLGAGAARNSHRESEPVSSDSAPALLRPGVSESGGAESEA